MYRVGIVTLSDKGASGKREDTSGPLMKDLLPKDQYEVMQLIESIANTVGYKEEILNKCIDIFSITMNMHHDFYLSWDLVEEYLKDKVKLS